MSCGGIPWLRLANKVYNVRAMGVEMRGVIVRGRNAHMPRGEVIQDALIRVLGLACFGHQRRLPAGPVLVAAVAQCIRRVGEHAPCRVWVAGRRADVWPAFAFTRDVAVPGV